MAPNLSPVPNTNSARLPSYEQISKGKKKKKKAQKKKKLPSVKLSLNAE
jgi:hypothetical protein